MSNEEITLPEFVLEAARKSKQLQRHFSALNKRTAVALRCQTCHEDDQVNQDVYQDVYNDVDYCGDDGVGDDAFRDDAKLENENGHSASHKRT